MLTNRKLTTPNINSEVMPPRMLIVDDQPSNIQLIYQIFFNQFQIFMATSGEQAVTMCVAILPDIVLMDVVMPGIGGLEACRQIHQENTTRELPIIFVTAGRDGAEEEACWDAGAVDFVTKPVIATTLRNRVRVHLMLKQQSDQLRELAYIDALTMLANRRCFDERFSMEWKRGRRAGYMLSVILIDVDFFKRYNDNYGHQAGDECLQAVGRALKMSLTRPTDLVARYGGEEFICILPETSHEGAITVATTLEKSIRNLNIAHATSEAAECVTISLGVATTLVRAELEMTALLKLADKQLYQSKNSGRGCFTAACLD